MNYKKILYIDCSAGISGDMLLAGLREIAAKAGIEVKLPELPKDGGNPEQLHHENNNSCRNYEHYGDHSGSSNHKSNQNNHDCSSGNAHCRQHHNHEHIHGRSYSEVRKLINRADTGEVAKAYALNIYEAIAKAEAQVHEKTLETVHFHEVGRDKAIENALGTGAVLEALGALMMNETEQKNIIETEKIKTDEAEKEQNLPFLKKDRNTENPVESREENKNAQIKSGEHQNRLKIFVSPIYDGTGFVDCAHGRIPVPVPAVQAMKSQCPDFEFRIAEEVKTEMVTPSGLAALIGIGAKVCRSDSLQDKLKAVSKETSSADEEQIKILAESIVAGTRNTGRGGLRLVLLEIEKA